ncbi:GNAT family N-acetyltransferase [Pseudoxanthomonas sp. UTMC 1351]|uniref:GNAT family N-acetyltransferase n=1 Tax=Pseudoxanthomonas sp. UTMC 1351 TaxID=2695853 RepID=UPI0034CF8A7D
MTHIIFTTRRTIGRHLQVSDVDALLEVYGDADAMRWVGDGEPLTREQCVEWVAVSERNYRTRGYGMSALVEHESGEVIGFCGLVHPAGQIDAELKYAFKRSHWGRGLATEAAAAMLTYAQESLGLRYAIATTAPQNLASQRVLNKAGMRPAPDFIDPDGTVVRCFAWHAPAPAKNEIHLPQQSLA